jgi:hypothetical protein
MTFLPTSIGIKMTSETGEVKTGLLGDTFTFTAPNVNGEFDVDAEYTLIGQLKSQTGFVVNGSLEVQAGKFILHNEYGPDFDVNLTTLLGIDGDYLFSQELPDGGLNVGPPIYVFDSSFALGGFEKKSASYNIEVVPEISTLWTITAAATTLAVMSLRRRRCEAA